MLRENGCHYVGLVAALAIALAPRSAAAQTPSSSRQIEDALRSGGPAAAVAAYEQATARSGKQDPVLLRHLAMSIGGAARADRDEVLRQAACSALVDAVPECRSQLQTLMGNPGAPLVDRIDAARLLSDRGDEYAKRALAQLVGAAVSTPDPVSAAAALRNLPDDLSVDPLTAILNGPSPEGQQMAATALAENNSPRAKAALAAAVAGLHGSARIAAVAGLARFGDKESLQQITEALPLLAGSDLYVAALALTRRGDSRGRTALLSLLGGPDPELRLRAAVALIHTDPDRAKAALADGMASTNAVVRADALRAWGRAGLAPEVRVRKALGDPDPWVRMRAAAVILNAPAAPPGAPRAQAIKH